MDPCNVTIYIRSLIFHWTIFCYFRRTHSRTHQSHGQHPVGSFISSSGSAVVPPNVTLPVIQVLLRPCMILNACVHRRHPCLTPLAEGGEIELKYLSQGYTWWPGQGSSPWPSDYESNTLSTRPPRPHPGSKVRELFVSFSGMMSIRI